MPSQPPHGAYHPVLSVDRRQFLGAAAAAAAVAFQPAAPLASEAQPGPLKAGAATSNITPPLGACNNGVIARGGQIRHIHDDLHARCLVLDNGRTRLAFAVCDARMIGRPIVDRAKELAGQATGLPPDQILISATHTHGAGGAIGGKLGELDQWYQDSLARRISDGIARAVNNLAPARIGWATASRPHHVFNRRWYMKPGSIPPNPFGESTDRVLMNPPAGSRNLVEPAGPVDPQLSILSVQHADGRPMALLANYGMHYVGGYVPGQISADYFALFADRVQQLLGADRLDPPFVGMMSNGASGDVNNIDARHPRPKQPPYACMREVAFDLAEEAARLCRRIKYLDRLPLAVKTDELKLGVRRPDEKRLQWARRALAAVKNPDRLSRSQVYAGEALELARFPATVPVKLQAIRIGDLGIVAIPCEVFAETGLAIKAQSPLDPTLVIELANGYNGYLPTSSQHELGGYETWPARSAYLEPQAESRIRATALRLLGQLVG
jgi:hypothetical protein